MYNSSDKEMFELLEKQGKRRLGKITTLHGDIYTPAFGPDATHGVIKNVAPHEFNELTAGSKILAQDAKARRDNDEIQFMLTNTYHMRSYPGDEFIRDMGGIHEFMNWNRPVLTDSGGFQVFSLIHGAKSLKGKVTNDGAFFNNPVNGNRLELTPEKAIDIQFNMGSDIMVVLDDCRHYTDTKELKRSVYRTIEWAKRCKARFIENLPKYGFPAFDTSGVRPQLFCVVQGGIDYELRKFCAEELVKIGFDGYGFGGWAINNDQEQILYKIMEYVASILPEDKPRYAMGMGTPDNMLQLIEYGYDLFDCVIPSRNGRHGLCYTTEGIVRILNAKYKTDKTPLDSGLKTIVSNYPKYYIHHLFKVGDSLGGEILTIQNLKYFNYVMRQPFLDTQDEAK
jgi:queuine tRNA-ribosyltransferase